MKKHKYSYCTILIYNNFSVQLNRENFPSVYDIIEIISQIEKQNLSEIPLEILNLIITLKKKAALKFINPLYYFFVKQFFLLLLLLNFSSLLTFSTFDNFFVLNFSNHSCNTINIP